MRRLQKNQTTSTMRAGWTMIELIFILIVIGILAAIALPKLAAVRDDAKLSADVSSMNICLRNVSAHYAATRISDINITSCNNVICYIIDINSSIMHIDLNTSGANYCADIENVGGHLVGTYQFAGESVNR